MTELSRFDKMTDRTRSSWSGVLDFFTQSPQSDLVRFRDQALRLIQQNGVTYNVYGDPKGLFRPWEMDLVPHVIVEEEWRLVESQLVQRAHLFDLLLRDIYGHQTLLKEGLVPPELIHGHPGFLRPCHGVSVPSDRRLHFYSADLGHGTDGSFWIMGDHTQALFGAGYALENRIVLSRVLDSLFGNTYVQRIAGTFHTLKQTLAGLAPKNRDNPRIVLLTPGPSSPFYFEHSYLARYLGYSLVHGEDLAFRDGGIYIKTLSGLQPVDVIFRFLYDGDADPLDLNRDSSSGIAGLVQAVRAGTVAVANSLGSGILENPAFMAFLPGLCKHFLGEDLKINNVATWWCGQAKERDYVLQNIEKLIIKPVIPEKGVTSIYTHELSRRELENLKDKIRKSPSLYVGQEKIPLSTTPVLSEGHFQPRPMCLRAFAVAGTDSFTVMPGGLTRISASPESFVVSDRQGSGSKDTWIVSREPVPKLTLLRPTHETEAIIIRSGGDVVSRVAENLFWLGRYTERLECLCRLLRALLLSQEEGSQLDEEYDALLKAYVETAKAPTQLLEQASNSSLTPADLKPSSRIWTLLEGGKIFTLLFSLHRSAQSVRDRLSDDAWMAFNRIHQVNQILQKSTPNLDTTLNSLDRLIGSLAAFDGLASQSMPRGQGWRFLDTGRRVERTLQVTESLLQLLVHPITEETSLLETIMDVNLCLSTHRRRYLSRIGAISVLDLMLLDERNPQSVAHQLAKLKNHVSQLPEERKRPQQTDEGKLIFEAVEAFRLADPRELAGTTDGKRVILETFLTRIGGLIRHFFEALNRDYFSHTRFKQQMQASHIKIPS